MTHKRMLFLSLALLCIAVAVAVAAVDDDDTSASDYTMDSSIHVYDDNVNYSGPSGHDLGIPKQSYVVVKGVSGHSSHNGYEDYFILKSSDKTSFIIDVSFYSSMTKDKHITNKYSLASDTAKKIDQTTLPAAIGTGAVLVQTSTDQINWTTYAVKCDVSGTQEITIDRSSVPEGGLYVQIRVAYEIYYKYGIFGWLTGYYNVVESYRFYLEVPEIDPNEDTGAGSTTYELGSNGETYLQSGTFETYGDNEYKKTGKVNSFTDKISTLKITNVTGKTTYEGVDAYYLNSTDDSNTIICKFSTNKSMTDGTVVKGDWRVSNDSATHVGDLTLKQKVSTGVVIVETSSNMGSWSILSQAPVTGKLTDDVSKIQIAPDKVKDGLYIRVTFAYEIYKDNFLGIGLFVDWYNILETYVFYVEINHPKAVVMHNLILNEDAGFTIRDSTTGELHHFDDMESGSLTTTGFAISNSKTGGMTPTVFRNSMKITDISSYYSNGNYVFRESGTYSIYLEDKLGIVRTERVNVTVATVSELENKLFHGEGVSYTTRVETITDSPYPSFKGQVYFNLYVTDSYLPVFEATVKNVTLDTERVVDSTTFNRFPLEAEGVNEYIITVQPKEDIKSGDYVRMTYHFFVLDSNTESNPHINQSMLTNTYYAGDFKSEYYGLKLPTKGSGSIIWAFDSEVKARAFGVEYEYALAVKSGNTITWNNKTYQDTWELTSDINEWVDARVSKHYIDLTDSRTYATLNLNQQFRTTDKLTAKSFDNLNLKADAILFPSSDMRESLHVENLPTIANKLYAYVTVNGVEKSTVGTVFIQDTEKITSSSVDIIDDKGHSCRIEYGVSVIDQLTEAGFTPGIVHITEISPGGSSEYDAYFLPDGYNLTTGSITVYNGGISSEQELKKYGMYSGTKVTFANITEECGNSTVFISSTNGKQTMGVSELKTFVLEEPGHYTMRFINCIGVEIRIDVTVSG